MQHYNVSMHINLNTLEHIIRISRKAGDAILKIYAQDFSVEKKADASPLTEADLASHRVIIDALKEFTPDIPVLSEESSELLRTGEWREWTTYWLIDPLDGTKEFVKRNGEFTVNIALIKNHRAVLGVVHIPVSNITYAGASELGAYKLQENDSDLDISSKISSEQSPQIPYRIVASRSHQSEALKEYLHAIGEHEILAMGSSLKFCLIAEGKADCYPRFGLTSEWDTAAAQAIVEAAGGQVTKLDGTPLQYNTKDEILNPFFMVTASSAKDWFSPIPKKLLSSECSVK